MADDIDMRASGGEEDFEFAEPKVGEVKDITPDGGVQKKVLALGEGWERPEKGDSVTVHYTGTLASDGSKFDSSVDRGEPFTFTLGTGSVIKGWDAGVATMRKGERAVLTCRADYAYGDSGSPPKIPGGATLDFEVELISWKSVKDIAGDGGVIKTVVEESSEWKKPSDVDEVVLTYSIKVPGSDAAVASGEGAVFEMAQGAPLGLRGLEVAVKSMKKGERAQLKLKPEYGYGDAGPEGVPPGSALEVDLKLDAIHEVSMIVPGVVKKTVEDSSEWRTASEGATVTIQYRATLPDGTVFDEAGEGAELTVVVDDEQVPEGVDLALTKMKQGERALVTISDAKYAFGDAGHAGRLAAVPPGAAPVTYDIKVVALKSAKEKWEMSGEEKVAAAQEAKDKGNAAYKAGRLERAARLYKRAVDCVGEQDYSGAGDTDGPEVKAQIKELRKSVWLNCAAVELKRADWRAAAGHAGKVLELDPACVKALYRRAQALAGLQELLDAERDVRLALDLDPNSADLQALGRRVKLLIKQQNKKDAGLYKSMFKALGKGLGSAATAAAAAGGADAAAAAAAAPDAAGGGDQAGGAPAETMQVEAAA